jgi:hypothetical protein
MPLTCTRSLQNRWGFRCTVYAFRPASLSLRLPALADLRLTVAMAAGRMVAARVARDAPAAPLWAEGRDARKLTALDLGAFAGGRDETAAGGILASLLAGDGTCARAGSVRLGCSC